MTKSAHLREAVVKLEQTIAKAKSVKQSLLHARNEQHGRMVFALTELEEIYEILTDPECTPELLDVGYNCNIDCGCPGSCRLALEEEEAE